MCHSILHRHVLETEFGTGSMKYLPKFHLKGGNKRLVYPGGGGGGGNSDIFTNT